MFKKISASILAASMVLAGVPAHAGLFGSDDNASSITKDTARQLSAVVRGTILQVSDATIESSGAGDSAGATAGGVVGGVAGASNNNGSGGLLGGVLGAVVGGIAGKAVAMAVGKQKGQDLVIETAKGDVVNITQAIDEAIGAFAEGDPVLIITKGGSARVIRDKRAAASAKPAVVAPAVADSGTPAN